MTARAAPLNECHIAIASPAVPVKTPCDEERIVPSALYVVREKTLCAAFFTVAGCAIAIVGNMMATVNRSRIIFVLIVSLFRLIIVSMFSLHVLEQCASVVDCRLRDAAPAKHLGNFVHPLCL